MAIKAYDYALRSIRSQIDQMHNNRQMQEPLYDPETSEAQNELQEYILHDSMAMAVSILARCDVINDARNDQVQSSARELIKLLAERLHIDVTDKYGVPI